MDFIAAIIGSAIGAVIAGVIIWVVSRLNLGLQVESFAWAIIAGALMAVLTNLILQFVTDFGGLGGLLVHLVVSAGVILASGSFLHGLRVNGYGGALLASGAIALLNFGVIWLMGLIGLG